MTVMQKTTCAGCGKHLEEPRRPGRTRKWCSERCRKLTCYGKPCSGCGKTLDCSDPTKPRSGLCTRCFAKTVDYSQRPASINRRERGEFVVWAWAQGWPMKQIAEEIGMSVGAFGVEMSRLREDGYDLPHRYAATRIRKSKLAREAAMG